MKNLIILGMLMLATLASAGVDVKLAQAQDGDLVATELTKLVVSMQKGRVEMPASKDPVHMSWAVQAQTVKAEATVTNLKKAQPYQAESRAFWTTVSGADFDGGITLPVSKSGALVRISPKGKAPMFQVEDLVLVSAAGQTYGNGYGIRYLVTPDQRHTAQKSHPFPENTAVFQMQDDLGVGEILMFADNMDYNAASSYHVEVLERDSDVVLHAQTGRGAYLVGQTLTINANVVDSQGALALESMTGTLISPSGARFPLSFLNGQAQAPLGSMDNAPVGALWEVEVTAFARNNKKAMVRRDVRTAFALGESTARFGGSADINRSREAFSAKLAVEAGVAGRFEVRGLLYGTAANGELQPIAVGHSADWLSAGEGSINLQFDTSLVKDSGLSAPYVVRDLQLIHQNRMSLIHQQQEGFAFDFTR